MRFYRGWLLLLILLPAATSSAQAPAAPVPTPQPSVTLPPELARVLTDYETAWRAKDAAALSRLFAEDGFVLPGGRPPVRGRTAIERHYTGQGGPLFLRGFAYSAEGSTGYILGGYSGQTGGPDEGKFTLTLKKGADGRWLIFSDMDNGNAPPRRPAPPPAATPAG
jgi:ketosteroid isomerase-like protein